MVDVIIDFETMGQNSIDCAVIDCSLLIFDRNRMISDNPYTIESINETVKFKLSIQDQVDNYGFVVYNDTIDWWSRQSKEARKHITPKKDDLTVKEFVDSFHDKLVEAKKIEYWWSRSNTFDPVILSRIYNTQKRYHDMNQYLHYGRVRDVRTFIDAKFNFSLKVNGFPPLKDEKLWNETFVPHDSRWDVLADTLRIQAILRAENDLSQI